MRAGFRFEARKPSHLNKLERCTCTWRCLQHTGPEARRSGCWVAPPLHLCVVDASINVTFRTFPGGGGSFSYLMEAFGSFFRHASCV